MEPRQWTTRAKLSLQLWLHDLASSLGMAPDTRRPARRAPWPVYYRLEIEPLEDRTAPAVGLVDLPAIDGNFAPLDEQLNPFGEVRVESRPGPAEDYSIGEHGPAGESSPVPLGSDSGVYLGKGSGQALGLRNMVLSPGYHNWQSAFGGGSAATARLAPSLGPAGRAALAELLPDQPVSAPFGSVTLSSVSVAQAAAPGVTITERAARPTSPKAAPTTPTPSFWTASRPMT